VAAEAISKCGEQVEAISGGGVLGEGAAAPSPPDRGSGGAL